MMNVSETNVHNIDLSSDEEDNKKKKKVGSFRSGAMAVRQTLLGDALKYRLKSMQLEI